MSRPSSIIEHYFPQLNSQQIEQFSQLGALYEYWNEQINVISRKDIDYLYVRHVLHSLSIGKAITFKPGTRILDIGTGGGFPGIPLAILFPECSFLLVDSIGKKIKVVAAVAEELGLENVDQQQVRGEDINEQFDFIVSRAVTALPKFLPWTKGKIKTEGQSELRNGLLYLKGGDFLGELKQIRGNATIFQLTDFFEEPFFETKALIHMPLPI